LGVLGWVWGGVVGSAYLKSLKTLFLSRGPSARFYFGRIDAYHSSREDLIQGKSVRTKGKKELGREFVLKTNLGNPSV